MRVVDANTGRINTVKDLGFADQLFHIKNTQGVWPVIDLIVKYWIESNPNKYDSFVVDVDKKRNTRATKYGSNKSMSVRSTLDIPAKIISMIRAVYKVDELPMDKKFFEEMWRRYPTFRVAQKL